MVRTYVALTPAQSAAVKRMAAQRKVPVSEILRQSVEAFIANGDAPPSPERRRRALEIIGAIKGGARDTAARHDDYAVEAYEA
jgi:hypothetical protein